MDTQVFNRDSQFQSSSSSLSEDTIPSVKGEWYNYRSVFTPERPLGYLMKCRANKDRAPYFVEKNADVDVVFVFSQSSVRVCSPSSSISQELLSDFDVDIDALNKTMISKVDITSERFNSVRDGKNSEDLIVICRDGRSVDQLVINQGMIIAITTPSGKYCLMRAVEVGPEGVRFDSCHVLL